MTDDLEQQWTNYVSALISQGKAPKEIVSLMIKAKWKKQNAQKFVDKVIQNVTEREQKYQSVEQQIAPLVIRALNGQESIDTLVQKAAEVEFWSNISTTDMKAILVRIWEIAVDQLLNDGVLDEAEDKRLIEFQKRFYLSQEDLDRNGTFLRIGKASILRDVLNGALPQRGVEISGPYAPNLQKGEQIIWCFPRSKYYEDQTHREYVGGSQGVSIRIMKGIYYRVGAFKGHTVEQTGLFYIDEGAVTLTNKYMYFISPSKSIRIPYKKIVTFQPFGDGIGVILDNAAAKQMIFKTGDGWFTYNLVTNLSRL